MASVLLVPDLLRVIVSFQNGLCVANLRLVGHLRRIHLSNYQLTTFLRDDMAPFHAAFPPWLAAHGMTALGNVLRHKRYYRTHLLFYAIIHGHVPLLKYLTTVEQVRITDKAWALAAIYGHAPVAAYLMDHHAESYESSVSDMVALHGHVAMLQCLYEKGAEIAPTVRNTACARGRIAVLEFAHAQALGVWHPSGVHAAARGGYVDVVAFLHAHAYDGFGPDTMNTAALYGHLDVVRFLHTHRREGCSPEALIWAAKYGRLPLVSFLDEMRAERDLTRTLKAAIKHGHIEVVRYLLGRHLREIDVKAVKLAAQRYNQGSVLALLKEARRESCSIQ
ncbi:hypothetical protein ACHHYP_20749 [Achlya hypogyna]|uniref:Uncharacterized protein n=1 Tax=Achlya hypogyna TaxID=1202772 RepID=A0A1V9YCA5_ACHHY|nr:hypothetical protein ACHHYP_20749 [Achlya hypogyna]